VSRRPAALAAMAAMATIALVTWLPVSARADNYGAKVSAIDNAFDPQIVRISPGEAVEWSIDGRSPHTITAADGSWGSGTLAPGQTFEHTFTQAGVYPYYCKFHGSPGVGQGAQMTGLVVVGDVPLPGPGKDVGPGSEPVPRGFAPTIRVPADYPTIQQAVDHAQPGGMVLVSPGIYHESVLVTVPYLTIRGMDRNTTILDGKFVLANGINVVEADGVTVQNLTARHFLLNGFYWSGVHGFWGSYLTAYNNGDYGIYAFASDYGQFDHSYASGSPDSGFYIGQCDPCHALIQDVLSENNALGYSGTNASGDLAIVNSEWRNNFSGIAPNTLDSEKLAPQHDVLIAGNYVHDNNSTTADTKDLEYPTWGIGIVVGGGDDDLITGNLVVNNATYGIAVIPNIDTNLWVPHGNQVRDNIVRGSGRADLALGAPSGSNNCFSGNQASTSQPPAIQLLRRCGAPWTHAGGGDLGPTVGIGLRFLDALDGVFPHGDWKTQPAPRAQPQMPGDPAKAPPDPAIPGQAVPQRYRIRAISTIGTEGLGPPVGRELTLFGVPLATSWWGLIIGLYGYVLPGFLYAAWVTIALWDLIRQESAPIPRRARWMAIVMLVPFFGPLLYYWRGHSPIPRQLRLMLVVGGALICALLVALAALLGG
jgi:plastocyanin